MNFRTRAILLVLATTLMLSLSAGHSRAGYIGYTNPHTVIYSDAPPVTLEGTTSLRLDQTVYSVPGTPLTTTSDGFVELSVTRTHAVIRSGFNYSVSGATDLSHFFTFSVLGELWPVVEVPTLPPYEEYTGTSAFAIQGHVAPGDSLTFGFRAVIFTGTSTEPSFILSDVNETFGPGDFMLSDVVSQVLGDYYTAGFTSGTFHMVSVIGVNIQRGPGPDREATYINVDPDVGVFTPAAVPEPGSVTLVGLGLIGLLGYRLPTGRPRGSSSVGGSTWVSPAKITKDLLE